MSKAHLILTLLILGLLCIRVISVWPLRKPDDFEVAEEFKVVNQYLSSVVDQIFPMPQSALMQGILLGNKQAITPELKRTLTQTATIHIAVVSGQNLSLIAGFILCFAKWVGRKRSVILTLIICTAYSLVTGFGIPVIRALVMVFFSSLAVLVGREGESPWILFLTGVVMVFFKPDWLVSISFQLSFIATFAVIVVAPIVSKSIKFLPDGFKEEFSVCLCSQALTLPIIAFNFHRISVLGLFVNLLVLWTIPIIMISGITVLALQLFFPPLAWVVSYLPLVFLTYFYNLISFFEKLPFASLYLPSISASIWLGYYICILGFIWIIFLSGRLNKPIKQMPIINSY